jgi:hypothetical protein
MSVKSPRTTFAIFLFAFAAVLNAQEEMQAAKPAVSSIVTGLPRCSTLRQQLVRGQIGDGIDKPFMQAMRQDGVDRAYIEIHGVWEHDHPKNLEVARRLYFRNLDGPHSEIIDSAKLKQIKDSGLEVLLDSVALSRFREAHLMGWVDPELIWDFSWKLHGSKIWGSTNLFATPWVADSPQLVFRDFNRRSSIASAASAGDIEELRTLISKHRYSSSELNWFLNYAVMSLWDNTDTIELLIHAGADANARFADNTTPLMLAYENACNIRPLLNNGARLDARNKRGQTALDLAKQRHDTAAIELLEQAASNQ